MDKDVARGGIVMAKPKYTDFKLWIADKLNRNPDYCWPELVRWALFDKFSDILIFNQKYKTKTCKQGSTYCGKCDHIKQRKDWMKYDQNS